MKLTTCTILIVISAATSHARLHETVEQCKARYGAPLEEKRPDKPAEKKFLFQMGVYRIGISFVNDRAVELAITRPDGGDMSWDAVTNILDANTEGSEFELQINEVRKNIGFWIRHDQKAMAQYSPAPGANILLIRDMDFHKQSTKLEHETESTSRF